MISTQRNLKNKFIMIMLFLICSLTLFSCKEIKTIDNVIAIGYLDNEIYLINSNHDSLLLEGYDLIQENVDDYMYVRKNNKYGYIDVHGKEIIEPIYDRAYAMNENKAVVLLNNQHLIINNNGDVLYTLPKNITSNSYFSFNKLLIEKDGKFAYLTFDSENNTFSLPGEFTYDYAGVYSESFAVIGKEFTETDENNVTTTSIKFNYLSINNMLLFTEFKFDEAHPFTNGYAKVGVFTKGVEVPCVDYDPSKVLPSRYYDMMVYRYLKADGSYIIDQNTDKPLECHYGNNPSDNVITTAVMKYFNIEGVDTNLFKSYSFYTVDGRQLYKSCFTYSPFTNINVFWPTNMVSYGPYHFFAYGKQSISWSILVPIEGNFDFDNLPISIDLKEKWVETLSNEYFLSKEMVKLHSENPFYVTDIIRPNYSTDTRPLMAVQISFSDNAKYGIIQFNYDEKLADESGDYLDGYSAYYIVPPIYDRIVF